MFPPLSSAWSLRIVRKLTRGAPCFTGLIGGYCTLNSQWSSCCALRLAVLPCSLGLLRPVSRTARGLRAPHWLRRLFRPHWAYFALLRSSIRNSRLATLPLASLLCSLDFRFACFAHCARRSSVPQGARFVRPPPLPHPQFAMVVPHLRTALAFGGAVFRGCALRFASCARHSSPSGLRCAVLPCFIGLTTACFRHRRRPSCAPLQFPLKSYGFPGAETARKRFLLWKMGFSDAAYCEPLHPSIQHGRPTPSHRPALTLARCSAPADFASLRVLGAPAASRPPTLASSLAALPASLGSSYRPALRWPGIPGLRTASRCPRPFTPSGLRRLRPVSRTARGLRAPPPYTPPGTIETRKGFGSTIRHGRSAPSHRAAFSGPVFRGCALRFAPCAHHFSPSGLRMLASSLAALPCAHNSQ